MQTVTRSALLLSFAASALPACAVDASSSTPPSDAPSAALDRAADAHRSEMSLCRADVVPVSGTMICSPEPAYVDQLFGQVTGMSNASYAGSCSGRATFEAPIPTCGTAGHWREALVVGATSYLNGTVLPASVCAASYLDYTVSVQTGGTTWSTYSSGRVYGFPYNGRCSLFYGSTALEDLGNITQIDISADSYEIESFSVPEAPPVIVKTAAGVEFAVNPYQWATPL